MQTTTPTRNRTHLIWANDLDHVSAELERIGAVKELDGFAFVDETIAPAVLVDLYRKLCQVGYVNGWLS